MMAKLLQLFGVLFLSCLLSACLEEPECTDTGSDNVGIRFRNAETGTALSLAVDSVFSVDYNVNFYEDFSGSSLVIPLSPHLEKMTFVFQSEKARDTLTLSYRYIPKLFGKPCDVELLFTDFFIEKSTFEDARFTIEEFSANVEVRY